MLEAAELALETLTERNQLLLREEPGIEVERPEDTRKDEEKLKHKRESAVCQKVKDVQ